MSEDWAAYWLYQAAHGRTDQVERGWCPECQQETVTGRMRGHEDYRPFCASCGEWLNGHLHLVESRRRP